MADVRINEYRLMRSRHGRMLGGVAAGLAQASGMDVTLVRLCIGAMVIAGFGVPVYILMWIILPEESAKRGRVIQPAPESTARGIRIALVVLAALSLLNKVGGFLAFANPHASGVGPGGGIGLVLLGIGIAVLFSRHRPDRSTWQPAKDEPVASVNDRVVDDEPRTYSGPFGEAMGTVQDAVSDALKEVRTTFSESKPRRSATAYAGDAYDYDAYDDDVDDVDDVDHVAPEPTLSPPRVAMATFNGEVRQSGGPALAAARVIGWLCMIWFSLGAIGTTIAYAFGAVSIKSPVVFYFALWFAWTAVTSTLGHAKFARAIIPTLALLLIPVGVGAASIRFNGEVGEHTYAPAAIHNATKNYRFGAGRLNLDLTKTEFTNDNTTVNARTGAGAIFVEVPNDVAVKVAARTQAGAYEIFGTRSDGFSPRTTINRKGCKHAKTVTLNLRTGAGYIQVHRANGHTGMTCAA